jgi:hypothetical protein
MTDQLEILTHTIAAAKAACIAALRSLDAVGQMLAHPMPEPTIEEVVEITPEVASEPSPCTHPQGAKVAAGGKNFIVCPDCGAQEEV